MQRVPSHPRSAIECHGYFRVNQERLLRAARAKGLENPTQVARSLRGVIAEATFFRAYYDQTIPSSRLIFALTTLLDAKVEEIFDPVNLPIGQNVTPSQQRSS